MDEEERRISLWRTRFELEQKQARRHAQPFIRTSAPRAMTLQPCLVGLSPCLHLQGKRFYFVFCDNARIDLR